MSAPFIDLQRIACRFPLLPRAQPARPPLPDRIAEVAHLARTAPDHADAAARTAAAHNKAALIASDCGHPDLARALCWHHFDRYTHTLPWTATAARRALEPLVNLARLHIRAHQPDTAITLLESLLTAVQHRSTTTIDSRHLDFAQVSATPDDHHQTHRWLWSVVLAEGIRALARGGRWDEALAHARRHHGIGDSLLDGRQIAVITHTLRGDHRAASTLLAQSHHHQPWQRLVAACLAVLLDRHAGQPATTACAAMLDAYLPLLPTKTDQTPFPIRVGLTIIDLAEDTPTRPALLRHLIHHVTAHPNGNIAREILTHPVQHEIPHHTLRQLATFRDAATPTDIPAEQLATDLREALAGRLPRLYEGMGAGCSPGAFAGIESGESVGHDADHDLGLQGSEGRERTAATPVELPASTRIRALPAMP